MNYQDKVENITNKIILTKNELVDLYKFVKLMAKNPDIFDSDDINNVKNSIKNHMKEYQQCQKKLKLLNHIKTHVLDHLENQLNKRISILKSQKILDTIPALEDKLVLKQLKLKKKLDRVNQLLLTI
jgi:hypothetical protein